MMESAIWYSCWNATLSNSGIENQNSFCDGFPTVRSVVKWDTFFRESAYPVLTG